MVWGPPSVGPGFPPRFLTDKHTPHPSRPDTPTLFVSSCTLGECHVSHTLFLPPGRGVRGWVGDVGFRFVVH